MLEVLIGLGGLAVVVTGAALAQQGALDPGLLPLMTILAMAAFLPVSEIAQIGRQLADTLGATRRVYALANEPIPVRDGPGVPPRKGAAALALEKVNFTYPGQSRRALSDVSFEIPAGKTVALVGTSGAGKTTTAQLLMRFWDADSGRITLNGADLRDYKLDELRRLVALVAQDTYLFNDSLRANITSLSGGQRQRVAIARAFLKDAPILVLDEATSHLDAVNEQAVRRALDVLQADRTTIVIAHRLSTVRDADLIVVLDQGRVAETGTHASLLARGGLYARLVSRQLASVYAPAAS